jgi:hypothetical protein
MSISPQQLKEQLSAYRSFFSGFKLEIIENSDFLAHKAVENLLSIQFKGVNSSVDVYLITKKLDGFIRNVKAEFDYIYVDFDKLSYPDFLDELSEYKVYGPLSAYHSSIIQILKILVIKIRKVGRDEQSENEAYELILDLIHTSPLVDKQKILFADNDELKNDKGDTEIDELILKQLDITLDSLL